MGSIQIVFLFDLNAFNNILSKPKETLSKRLQYIRLACLRILTEFANKTSSLRWGIKFFDSVGSVTQKMCKFSFSDLSLEAFEIFESEICLRYERHVSYAQALSHSMQNNIAPYIDAKLTLDTEKLIIAPIKILHLALSQVLCEFQWEYMDMWSPSTNKLKNMTLGLKKRNMLILFSDFSDHDDRLQKYFGLDSIPSKTKFSNTILPQTLREQLLVKANIHWVWLNVCQDQTFLGDSSSIILPLLSEALHSIQGSLIPLSLLSQPLYYTKDQNLINGSIFKDSILQNSNIVFNNSLLPFSSILYHSIHEPFYSKASSTNKLISSLICNNIQISVQLIDILNSGKKEFCLDVLKEDEKNMRSTKSKMSSSTTAWSRLVVQGALSRTAKHVAEDILLCLPYSDESNVSDLESFTAINTTLCDKKINLVVVCITEDGIQMPGLLTPLSNEAAIISVLDPLVHFMNKPKIEDFSAECFEERGRNMTNVLTSIKSLKPAKSDDMTITCVTDSSLKQYQMESLETWFKPTASVSNLALVIKSKKSNLNKIASFHKMLQCSVRNNFQATSSKEDVSQSSVAGLQTLQEKIENEEVFTDLNLDQLLSTSKDIYNCSLESSASVLDSAKKIVRLVSNYYKKHGGSCFEENVQNFMKDNLFLTVRRISEKYEMLQSEEDTDKKIRECQLQILLLLEVEALNLPPDKSVCVNSVTALLRMMSFYSGALELNKLLYEILRENYSGKLYDVLVDIGDELDMPIFEDADSSDSPDVLSSELMEGELFGSTISSNMSTQSSSSVCSRKDNNKKLVRHRSDISDTIRSRQVLLPGTSPKKKKGKCTVQGKSYAQKKAIRCSPRIAAKKNERQTRSKEVKSGNVRRNLFPKEKTCQTPKRYKNGQPTTPRSKKKSTAKNKFVAETPSYKQNHSALQRRKSSIEMEGTHNFPKEIAESPKISESAKSDSNKELLRKLQQRSNEIAFKCAKAGSSSSKSEAPSLSFPRYTPESKKRLSLKLFSKLLTSPTARMGIKRCTKRLFDQVSPHKNCESIKKHKPQEESKLAFTPVKELNSLNIQEENLALIPAIVAETSSNKQNESEAQLRKLCIKKEAVQNSQEISKSPSFSNNATSDSSKGNIQRTESEENSENSLKKRTSFTLPQYTPDSKKRLSLKLFSKFLTSPTARTGIKKCSKRLFEQASPEKYSESHKKFKLSEEFKFASTSQNESNSTDKHAHQ